MPRPRRVVFPLLVTAAFMMAIALTPGPTSQESPYLSPLSDLLVGSVVAAPGCQFKACAKEPGRKTPDCHRTTSATNCIKSSTGCSIVDC